MHSLPDGYDTVIDEEGGNVSAGEKQLLTIARAFLADPSLLILDEATSSVDTRTEVLVQQAMAALRTDRTSFVIAHRLSTIRDADLILVMEAGRSSSRAPTRSCSPRDGAYCAALQRPVRRERHLVHRDAITAALVARLVAEQFPAWAELPVVPVAESGWDNRTFRLGDALTARLPTAEWYVAAVEKEHTWLPRLAPHLPLPIPEPVALGSPGAGIRGRGRCGGGSTAAPPRDDRIADPVAFARDLARFLVALWGVDAAGGPAAGAHSFHRGGALAVYDEETRAALAALGPRVDRAAATRMWDDALAAGWTGAPVWFHGDVADGQPAGRRGGRLSAVIDFGTSRGRRPRLRPRDRLDAVRRARAARRSSRASGRTRPHGRGPAAGRCGRR